MSVVKIDGTSIPPIGNIQPGNKISRSNNQTGNSEQDKVAVSENAQVFQSLVQKAKQLPEVREDVIRAFTEQIASGEFNLDADSIAASMLSQNGKEEK